MADAFDDILPPSPVSNMPAAASGGVSQSDSFEDIVPSAGGSVAAPEPSGLDNFLKGIGGNAQAFGANVEHGFAEVLDQVGNVSNYLYRHEPDFLPPNYPVGPSAYGMIEPGMHSLDIATRTANRLAGRPETAPWDFSGAVDAFYHANELKQKYPLAGTLGGIGGAALFPGMGEFGAGFKNPWARSAVNGAFAGGVYGGLSEAGDEAKAGQQIDPMKVAGSAAGGAALGAPFSMLLHGGVGAIKGLAKGFAGKEVPPEPTTPLIPGPTERAELNRLREQQYQSQQPQRVAAESARRSMEEQQPYSKPIRGYISMNREVEPQVTPGPSEQAQRQAMESQHGKPHYRMPVEHAKKSQPKPRVRMSTEHARTGLRESEQPISQGQEQPTLTNEATPEEHALPGKTVRIGHEQTTGWRAERVNRSRPATPEESKLLANVAALKIAHDKAESKLQSAIKKLFDELKLKPKGRATLTPEQQAELDKLRQEVGAKPVRTKYYREAALSEPIAHEYNFKSPTLKGKLEETKQLAAHYQDLHKKLDKELKNKALEALPKDETIAVKSLGKTVNVTHRDNVHRYDYPSPEAKSTVQKREAEMKETSPRDQAYTGKSLLDAVESDPEVKAKMEEYGLTQWFRDIVKPGTLHSDPLMIGTIVRTIRATHKLAESKGARINPAETLAKVLHTIKVNHLEKELTPRMAQRLTMTQTTSDVIRHLDPDLAYKRDAYLAAREIATAHGRELTHEERELVKNMTSNEIRASSQLKGWTSLERNKEADAKALDAAYEKVLTKRIKELDEQGIKPGPLGLSRLRAMLELDLKDLKGEEAPGSWLQKAAGKAIRKATTGEYVSTFNGNHRVGLLHLGEALVANGSLDPVATAKSVQKILRSKVALEFANSLAGKGMQAKLTDGEKFAMAAWVDKHINNPLQHKMESTKVGKHVHRILSAEMEERIKTMVTSVVHAHRVAKDLKYPGGVDGLMQDYVDAMAGKTIPSSRQQVFGRAQVDMFIARNKAIMHMPEGPLKERTAFQRHGSLIASSFPFLRNVVQQTRVLTSYVDDLSEALATKNKAAAAKAIGRIIAFHMLVSVVAGRYTLPDYVWDVMDKVDHKKTEQLKKTMDFMSQHGFRRDEKFGAKYFPALSGGNLFIMQTGQDVVRTAKGLGSKDQNEQHLIRATAMALSAGIIDNIGHVGGLNNLSFLATRLIDGAKGRRTLSVYSQPNLLEKMAGEDSKKLAEKTVKYNEMEGFMDWLLGGQNKDEAKLHNRVDKLESMEKRLHH